MWCVTLSQSKESNRNQMNRNKIRIFLPKLDYLCFMCFFFFGGGWLHDLMDILWERKQFLLCPIKPCLSRAMSHEPWHIRVLGDVAQETFEYGINALFFSSFIFDSRIAATLFRIKFAKFIWPFRSIPLLKPSSNGNDTMNEKSVRHPANNESGHTFAREMKDYTAEGSEEIQYLSTKEQTSGKNDMFKSFVWNIAESSLYNQFSVFDSCFSGTLRYFFADKVLFVCSIRVLIGNPIQQKTKSIPNNSEQFYMIF